MNNIVPFPSPAKPEEVLEIAKSVDYNDVMVIGWDKAGDMIVVASEMTDQDMLYLLALAQRDILE